MKIFYFEIIAGNGNLIYNGKVNAESENDAYNQVLEISAGKPVGKITIKETK